MITLPIQSGTRWTPDEASRKLKFLVRQGKRLGLLQLGDRVFDQTWNDFLEDFREELTNGGGQYLSLDCARFEEKSLAELLIDELATAHAECPLRINLPVARSKSPFIQRAIIWQRLCDRLIEDEKPTRPSLLVIENFEQADEQFHNDVERLIRFHTTHHIRRTFLLALRNEEGDTLPPSLSRLVDLCIEC